MNIVNATTPLSTSEALSGRQAPKLEGPLRILCVDDCESDVLLILHILREGGFEVTHEQVETRQALLTALEKQPWDLVISDYTMPQFDGIEALKIVVERAPDVPFILVSGAIGEDIAVEAMKAGAADYLMKDALARLVPVVNSQLANAESRRAERLATANLRSSETLLNSIVNSAADGIVLIDETGKIEFVNAAMERLFGWKSLELIGKNVTSLMVAGQRTHSDQVLANRNPNIKARILGAGRELKAQRKDGGVFPIELTVSEACINGSTKYTGILRDVSERKRAEERIRHLVHYDELTGLPNRVLFSQLLDQALSEAKFANKQVAVLFIDLDRFKLINDTLSHESGDYVLKEVASRLVESPYRHDTVSRFGGDEFIVLMRDCSVPADPSTTAQELLDALARPFIIDGQEYHLTASIGISTFPSDGQDVQTMLKNADTAMFLAKERGKNNYQFYSSQMNARSFERLVLERFLRRALEQNQFRIYYQPKIDLESGRITGMEALLRWMQPNMGVIAPAKFIPLAEETGLIVPIGAWVLKTACEQARLWQRQGLPPLRVAVNLSARQFADEDTLLAAITGALEQTGMPPHLLELEITESVAMNNPEHAVGLLKKLKALGVTLSIDDFGTGYSSLAYLKRFPIDSVKIDRSFIKDVPFDADDVAISKAVIALAHSLHLKVIAEGVETDDHVTFLRQHNCDEAQGYLFAKPLPPDEFVELLVRRGEAHPPQQIGTELPQWSASNT